MSQKAKNSSNSKKKIKSSTNSSVQIPKPTEILHANVSPINENPPLLANPTLRNVRGSLGNGLLFNTMPTVILPEMVPNFNNSTSIGNDTLNGFSSNHNISPNSPYQDLQRNAHPQFQGNFRPDLSQPPLPVNYPYLMPAPMDPQMAAMQYNFYMDQIIQLQNQNKNLLKIFHSNMNGNDGNRGNLPPLLNHNNMPQEMNYNLQQFYNYPNQPQLPPQIPQQFYQRSQEIQRPPFNHQTQIQRKNSPPSQLKPNPAKEIYISTPQKPIYIEETNNTGNLSNSKISEKVINSSIKDKTKINEETDSTHFTIKKGSREEEPAPRFCLSGLQEISTTPTNKSPSEESPPSKGGHRSCFNKYCPKKNNKRRKLLRAKLRNSYIYLCKECKDAYMRKQYCLFCHQIYLDEHSEEIDGKEWIQCEQCSNWVQEFIKFSCMFNVKKRKEIGLLESFLEILIFFTLVNSVKEKGK